MTAWSAAGENNSMPVDDGARRNAERDGSYTSMQFLGVRAQAMDESIHEVDARGLACPLPLLKAKKGLNALPAGALLRVLSTDTGSVRDFRVFCEQSGNALIESVEIDGTYRFLIRKHTS
jgi:tRNA 2-thiouridine synthesizing protein A